MTISLHNDTLHLRTLVTVLKDENGKAEAT